MASADIASQPPDRHSRRRPFTSWVKRLTNLKSSDSPNAKKNSSANPKSKKSASSAQKNNPYPQSGPLNQQSDVDSNNGHLSFSTPATHPQGSFASLPTSSDTRGALADCSRSAAPTVGTNPDTVYSDGGNSKALTATTAGGALSTMDGVGGANSTFSSPNHSTQSLATTLTTIQSTAPNSALNPSASLTQTAQSNAALTPGGTQFSHQYPVSPTPASAVPAHLAPVGPPTTYSTATANNLLTDDASILTLASSSKRRRRRSMDTDASVRALAPSSVWGGSRESLPLSVLSGNADYGAGSGLLVQGQRPSVAGIASAERASVYSSQGVTAPILASERNSYYAASHKQANRDKDKDARSIDGRSIYRDGADGKSVNFDGKSLHGGESLKGYESSIRSGALGHARADSIPGNGSPIPTPGLSQRLGVSRRDSDWTEKNEDVEAKDVADEDN